MALARTEDAPAAGRSSLARVTRQAFWAGFLVRVAYLTLAHTYRIHNFADHFDFGWEMGRIARALVTGYGFAEPFHGHTGPTAWVGPLYPLLIAAIFKLTGVYTPLSAWLLMTVNSLFSALVVFPMAAIGRRMFRTAGETKAASITRWSVWLWALYPAAMQYAVRWIWEMSLSTLLFTAAFALALRMRQTLPERTLEADFATKITRDWALFGLLWGAIALANPALVTFLPCAGLWVLAGQRTRGFFGAVLSGLVFLAILAPWMVRNARVFHHFIPLRANFGAELALGNGPGATGLLMEYHHPQQDPQQFQQYAAMGEYLYAQTRGALARDTIRRDPWLFVRNSLKRLDFFWFSVPGPGSPSSEFFRRLNYGFITTTALLGLALALRRGMYGAWLIAFAFLTLPAVYYIVTIHARFRHPIEPLLTLLSVYLFQSAEQRRRVRARS